MIAAAESWLPETALMSPMAVEAVADCLREWSQDWLVSDSLTPALAWRKANAWSESGFTPLPDMPQAVCFTLLARPETARLLAGAMLARPIESREIHSPADCVVIEQLSRTALQDLSARLSNILGPAQPNPSGASERAYALSVQLDGHELLAISASRARIVQLAKSHAGTPRNRARPVRPRLPLADHALGIGAIVGRSRIGLHQLERLGVGDVITLSTPIDARLDITVDGTVRGHDVATLAPGEQRLSLQIERYASEW